MSGNFQIQSGTFDINMTVVFNYDNIIKMDLFVGQGGQWRTRKGKENCLFLLTTLSVSSILHTSLALPSVKWASEKQQVCLLLLLSSRQLIFFQTGHVKNAWEGTTAKFSLQPQTCSQQRLYAPSSPRESGKQQPLLSYTIHQDQNQIDASKRKFYPFDRSVM